MTAPDFSDLEAIDVPLRDLPDETAARLWLAVHRYGRSAIINNSAARFYEPELHRMNTYRLAPLPKTPDTVDWSELHPDIVAVARDEDGAAYAYSRQPAIYQVDRDNPSCWDARKCSVGRVDSILASYKRGTCDWTESLQIRPGHEVDQ